MSEDRGTALMVAALLYQRDLINSLRDTLQSLARTSQAQKEAIRSQKDAMRALELEISLLGAKIRRLESR